MPFYSGQGISGLHESSQSMTSPHRRDMSPGTVQRCLCGFLAAARRYLSSILRHGLMKLSEQVLLT